MKLHSLFAIALGFSLAWVPSLKASTVVYYACVVNSSTDRTIRMVNATEVCKSTEHKINWNQQGSGLSLGTHTQGGPFIALGGPDARSLVLVSPPLTVTGIYFVSASALLDIAAGDGAYCYATTAHEAGGGTQGGSNAGFPVGQEIYQQASITDSLYVTKGDWIVLVCYSANNTGLSNVYNSALTAILIQNIIVPPGREKASAPIPAISGGPVAVQQF